MKILTNAEDIVQGARDDRYSHFTAAQLLDDLVKVEALRARIAELEAVAETQNKELKDAVLWVYERHIQSLADYKTSSWKNALEDFAAYKSKHTSEQGEKG